jgi:hypothetical protein
MTGVSQFNGVSNNMANLLVRNVAEDLITRLHERAAAHKMSA